MPKPAIPSTPIGSVLAFAGEITGPDNAARDNRTQDNRTGALIETLGWMACDGRSLPVQQYPELFNVLGYRYGGKDEVFNIPDIPPAEACPKLLHIIHFANPDLLLGSVA